MNYLLHLLSFLAILCVCGCTAQKYSPDTYTGTRLYFGSGGGITGAVTTYCLLDNGRLFRAEDLKESFERAGKVPAKKRKALFEQCQNLDIHQYKISRPGNLYHFIELRDEAGQTRLTWGATDYQPAPEVLELYRELMAAVSRGK